MEASGEGAEEEERSSKGRWGESRDKLHISLARSFDR